MPATHPRVNVVLDEPVYQELRRWAKREGVSLSLKVRDLVKDALEFEEDRALGQLADKRLATFDRKNAKTHAQAWGLPKRARPYQDAENVRQPVLFIWSIWFVWSVSSNWFVWFVLFIWLNQTNRINQMNQINKTNQINQTDRSYPSQANQ